VDALGWDSLPQLQWKHCASVNHFTTTDAFSAPPQTSILH